MWPELSELSLLVVSCYGYGKGKQLVVFVCLVVLSFYPSLFHYLICFSSVFFACGVGVGFFVPLILFIVSSNLQREKKIALESSYLRNLCCVSERVAGHFAEGNGR